MWPHRLRPFTSEGTTIFKNVASQKITLLAIDISTNAPKTGDSANITAYVSKDDGAVTVLGDTTATEKDATNAPGLYDFDVTQTESNADKLVFSGKSSTSNIRIIPVTIYTRPNYLSSLAIDSNGRVDVIKIAGTTQTARDIGASVLLSSGTGTGQLDFTSGVVKANVTQFNGTNGTFSGGRPEVNTTHLAGTAYASADLSTTMKASINTEVDTALADVRLDELLAADSDIDGAAPPTVGSVFHELMTKTAGSFTYDQTTDSLEAIRDKETDIETDTQDIQSRLPAALGANGNIKADVRDYNGTAGTFSGGRPEVNTSHWGGTAVASALVRSNLIQVGGSATPVTNLGIVFETDFATNYNTTLDMWSVNTTKYAGEDVSTSITGVPQVDVVGWGNTVIPVSYTAGYPIVTIKDGTGTGEINTNAGAIALVDLVTATTTVGSVTGAVGSVTGNVGGNVVGSVASVTGAVGSVTGNVGGNVVGSVASVTGNVGGNVVGTIGGLTTAALADFFDTNSGTTYASAVAGSVVKEITDNAGGGGLTVGAIADGVWDEVLSGHLTAGTTGNALNAAGSAGDPWSTTLPGSYTGTQAGFVFGTLRASNLNILSPFVAEDNSLELVIGDDYYAADSRNLQFTYGASPSLSGATVYLDIQTDKDSAFEGTNITSTTGSVSGTTTQLVSFDLPGTTTDDFDEGWRAYRVRAVLSNSHTVTLTRGRLNMLSRGNDAPV